MFLLCCAASFEGAILTNSHRTRVPRNTAEPQGLKLEQEFRKPHAFPSFSVSSVLRRAHLKVTVSYLAYMRDLCSD